MRIHLNSAHNAVFRWAVVVFVLVFGKKCTYDSPTRPPRNSIYHVLQNTVTTSIYNIFSKKKNHLNRSTVYFSCKLSPLSLQWFLFAASNLSDATVICILLYSKCSGVRLRRMHTHQYITLYMFSFFFFFFYCKAWIVSSDKTANFDVVSFVFKIKLLCIYIYTHRTKLYLGDAKP
jgi:hypothetical protein